MTKKQIFLLLSFFSLGMIGMVAFAAWWFNSVQEISLMPSQTRTIQTWIASSTPQIDGSANGFSTSLSWPTITPAFTSMPTNTPTAYLHAQVDAESYLKSADDEDEQSQSLAAKTITPSPTIKIIEATTQSFSEASTINTNEPIFSIGKSVDGHDLWMYRFGLGPVEKLIVAGIHGGYEYNTTNLANELILYLQEHPELIPEDTTLFILPSLNPDGLQRSHGYAGRANSNNVDLNRNWDFNWKNTWDPAGCWAYLPIFGGEFAFSEPETSALRDFIDEHEITAIISYHSAALGIFAGGMPGDSISVSLAESIAEIAPYPYPPIQTGCETTGQFVDYTASYGIPSVDIELTNHRDSDFEINLEILRVFLFWKNEDK